MATVLRFGGRIAVLAAIFVALTVLSGCGGGGGGGIPGSSGIQNLSGVDIRDTWKSTGPIKSYFGLEEGGDAPRITGFDSSGFSILGSKDGITYGQRQSGPTDTIDIDFTGYFDQLPDRVRGALERAGKSWSYRLVDVLGSHQSTDEVVTRVERTPDGRIPPREVDGVLVDIDSDFMNPAWDYVWGNTSGRYRTTEMVGEDFTARTGWIDLAAVTINRGSDWLAHIASHEMGHVLGHAAGEPGDDRSRLPEAITRYVDYDLGVWTGPALTAANRGRQVPFQRLDENRNPTSSGEVDFGHLGACVMLMSYCGSDIEIPHEMDFAFMKDIGYTVEDSYPVEPEQYSYGAWADHSAWVVMASRTMTFSPYRITDRIDVEADVYGVRSDQDFAEAHTGTLTWEGSLLATDMAKFAPVFGDAEIILSADTLEGSTQFSNLQTVQDVEGQAHLTGWRKSTLEYTVRVEENGFTDADGKVAGGFYGPNHEEVAGILDDGSERILGAFGGTRSEN